MHRSVAQVTGNAEGEAEIRREVAIGVPRGGQIAWLTISSLGVPATH